MNPKPVGIIYKPNHDPARIEAGKLEKWLKGRALKVVCEEMKAAGTQYGCLEESSKIPKNSEWVVVLGGDGTLLGAARRLGRHGVPLLGVNVGGLGFLTGTPLDRLYDVMELLLAGRLQVEERVMLESRVMRERECVCEFNVLNDVVVNKRTLARIVDLDVAINQEFLTTFRADGLIISTPTGSTAYNLSAGGPILYPTMHSFILTPICPFALTNRPILLPDSATIQITMRTPSTDSVILTFDGQAGFDFLHRDTLSLRKSKQKINLLKPSDYSYFEILRTKLMWGGGPGNQDGKHKKGDSGEPR
jgi:NAD+ kinase